MGNYRLINNVLGWITCIIASVVYLMTMEPTASFWDCGEFIASAYKLEVGHPPGAPFFMLTANLFTQLASSPEKVPLMVNAMSALFSGLTILFLFWSITHMARNILVNKGQEINMALMITIMGSGLVGALVYTFSDTFWFSAVEGEVYAYSSLFTAVVFWLILKWEDVADRPHADRWIVLIAYLMGLSIGVHLLNLLCIPAIVLVYYYKKFDNPTMKGTLIALAVSFAMIALMMYGVVQGLVEVAGWFELLFVNGLGLPYNSGVYAYVIALALVLGWGIYETMVETTHPTRMKISFILSIALLGIPFIGDGYLLGLTLIALLTAFLFFYKKVSIKILNTILVSLMVIVVGYSSYALIMIRSTAGTPMDQNSPEDIFTLRTYLAREQYGKTPLLYGQTYASELKYEIDDKGNCVIATRDGQPTWSRIVKKDASEKDKYYISRYETEYDYVDETKMLFPRMYSSMPNHVAGYKEWANITGRTVSYSKCGRTTTVVNPTFAENIRFFVNYQLNFMYWRYFMWNFSGRQNDIQGHGEILHGSWITGFKFIDKYLVGPQEDMPYDIVNNKGHNVYYMLPLLLGILGIFFQAYRGQKGIQAFWVTFFLFFMTGIAIVLYLNQTPYQPRERDYAYAGSFYAFCIWIGFGVAALAHFLESRMKGILAAALATLACLIVPIQMACQNWDDHDRSHRYVARDFGANYLESCEPNSIIFTNGDNDTFPLWYAQEVEGIRTDVRVCNTSYLQTDWYIDQMKRQAYKSDPLPISWDRSEYVQGTRDAAYIVPFPEIEEWDLNRALNFVRSDDPRFKKLPGYSQDFDYIPTDKLIMPVDSATVVDRGVISPQNAQYITDMMIDLSGKNVLGKHELIILDMLQNNDWERPIYYAITVSPDQFVKLDGYFQQTGLAHQIVPMETKGTVRAINTEKMYDNVMNKFRWGGVDKPGVYLDENVMRMCKSYRVHLFDRLAGALLTEGKPEKALEVLDRAMEVLPPENVPMDATGLSLAEYYYILGENQKAEEIYKLVADNAMRNLNWFFRLEHQHQLRSVWGDLEHNMMVMQEIARVTKQYNPEFIAPYQQEFDEYRMVFSSAAR